jgi:FtsP/CotA-like multicopper oxidase with cupredoxin domain
MQAGLKNAYESIKAFSETDFTEDLKKFDVPTLVVVIFDADNPGLWAFHCHNLYHMVAGMFSTLVYRGFASN